jgi:hypothetical protein
MGIVSPVWVDRHRVQHVCPDLDEQLMVEWLVRRVEVVGSLPGE